MKTTKLLLTIACALMLDVTHASEPPDPEVFGAGVRPTPWLTPAKELESFHLHQDFEIRLFASEPQIAKPLNLAPDSRGRLWVTCTQEYPYPAESSDVARDFLMVLEDTDGDGAADQFTRFADRLNIPMGVIPYGDGCICFSIPDLLYLRDTDGDGVCDRRERILGPFDTSRDTHGMINALRDGGDGWIYACHGFNNRSEVSGSDGHVVSMTSGNTFRFRPDGSRIELYTQGQVNPFGMTEDEWGYRYSADCHSKPITQLIRGACYPSFGRPHDGLGFLPPMMDHLHGSTAISGIQYIGPTSPMRSLRGQFVSGNVMTSRINRNRLTFTGATASAEPLDDFLSSDDPWFRPVDIRLSPDGNLYVADFYNKIIGHYEVPLDHPGRDRTSGRIWQLRYVGERGDDRGAEDPDDPSDETVIQSARSLRRLGRLAEIDLHVLFDDDSPRLHVEALRLLSEHANVSNELLDRARTSLQHTNPHVRRAAAECLGQVGTSADAQRLLDELSKIAAEDPVTRQSFRIAIRSLLQSAPEDAPVWSADVSAEMASIMLGMSGLQPADVILRYLEQQPNAANRAELLAHATQNAGKAQLERAVKVARKLTSGNLERSFEMLDAICGGQRVRAGSVPPSIRDWASELLTESLESIDLSQPLIQWSAGDGEWPMEPRQTTDAGEQRLASSFGRGEQYTGRWVSDVFRCPPRIRFYLAGHNGFPKEADHSKNRVWLMDPLNGRVLLEAKPPRNDRAILIDWDTSEFDGRRVRIECVDADDANAYAWIALGKFDPSWLHSSDDVAELRNALAWITRLRLDDLSSRLWRMLEQAGLASAVRAEIARTLADLKQDPVGSTVFSAMQSSDAPGELVERSLNAFRSSDDHQWNEIVKELCKRFSAADQRSFVLSWVGRGAPLEDLLSLVETGSLSRSVLVDPDVEQALQPRVSEGQAARIKSLTTGIETTDGRELDQKLAQLLQQISNDPGDYTNGQKLFKKHCAACHQLRGEGAVVGPQLDGAATRSAARLLEDIVVPDRNIDRAFRTTSFLLDDGRVQVGLITDENDRQITLVESTGKSVTLDQDSIELRKEAGRSLMPSNLADAMEPEDFADLLRFIRG